MNISDEAVEAALKAHLAHKSVRSPDNAKSAMRAALEAAAPYMLADAWDAGVIAEANKWMKAPKNPYKATRG